MISKLQLHEAIRVGPWRVARKHLLFILLFCIVIVIFGVIVLETHAFESDDEENDEEDDDGDEDGYEFGKGISGGDWVMVAIMVSAGVIALLSAVACFMAKTGVSEHLRSPGSPSQPPPPSVYTVQYNGDSKWSSINAAPRVSYSAPQPMMNGQMITTQAAPQALPHQGYPAQQAPTGGIQQQYAQPAQQHHSNQQQPQQLPQQHLQQKPRTAEQIRQPQSQSIQIQIQPQLAVRQPQPQASGRREDPSAMKQRLPSNPSAPPQTQIEKPPPYSP